VTPHIDRSRLLPESEYFPDPQEGRERREGREGREGQRRSGIALGWVAHE